MHTDFAIRAVRSQPAFRRTIDRPSPARHCALAVVSLLLANASAQSPWPGPYQTFNLERLGLFTAVHTGPGGIQESYAILHTSQGHVCGSTIRYQSGVPFGSDAWCWDGATTRQIGLTGGTYSDLNGFQHVRGTAMGDGGQVAGASMRVLPPYTGQDSWVWNGNATMPIGLVGGEYLGSGGHQWSEPVFVNRTGLVAGHSKRITNVVHENGQDAWLWDGSTTLQLGYRGPGYVTSNGYQYSRISSLDDAGRALGHSERFVNAYDYNGQDPWIWQGGTTTRIGLDGPAYVGPNGYRYNGCVVMNRLGKATGLVQRRSGATALGTDSWFWNGSWAVQIGLWGNNYTCPSGLQISEPQYLNDADQVAGHSVRYTGADTINGQDTWVWRSSTGTRQIGLVGAGHTGTAGYQSSTLLGQNTAGQVIGKSARVADARTFLGEDAWFWNGATTIHIGLVGGEFTSSSGIQVGNVLTLTQSGRAGGTSTRFLGTTTNGRGAWIFDGTSTLRVGLWGGAHTGTNGYQDSSFDRLDERGNAAGGSWRVVGVNSTNGKDAWYYDAATHTTHHVLAGVPHTVRTNDGFAFSEATMLTADGYLLGRYQRFFGGVDPGEFRGFAYRSDLGFTDLGALVAGGLGAAGWDSLREVNARNWMAEIVGHGYVAGQTAGNSAFVLRPPTAGAARNTVYGSGCGGLGLGAGPAPVLGSTLRYTVAGIPPGAAASVLLLGLSGIDPGAELTALGAPGCFRLLDLTQAATVVVGWWSPSYDLALPWQAAMIGLPLHGQAACLVPGANPLGAITSNGVRSVVGWY